MPSHDPRIAHLTGRVGSLSRSRPADDPELVKARRDLRTARIEQHVRESLSNIGPLTAAERDRLAALLYAS